MREILFRGKRLDNGEWVQGYLYKRIVHLSGFHQNVVVDAIEVYDGENPLGISYYTISPDTVGQYTGQTDRNGQKIFEGDIIKRSVLDYNWEKIFIVTWNESFPGWWEYRYSTFYALLDGNCEVIGNIHDNPDLLKGE